MNRYEDKTYYIFLSIPRFHLTVQYLHVHLFLPPENMKTLKIPYTPKHKC